MKIKGSTASNAAQKAPLAQTIKLLKYNKHKDKNNQSRATLKQNKQNYYNPTHSSLLSRMVTSKASHTHSLKSRYDELINQLFMKIDFDCSGFITGTKIAYYKQMPQKVYYFLGGVFQKVRQLGTVTYKMFASLCNQEFMHAKANDLQNIFSENNFATKNNRKREGNKSKLRISINKNGCKTEFTQKQNQQSQLQFQTKKVEKSSQSQKKKYSLKLKTKESQKLFGYQRDQSSKSIHKKLNLSLSQSSYHDLQHVSFQSQKLKQLTQRLNRQIEQSSQRLYKNRLIG